MLFEDWKNVLRRGTAVGTVSYIGRRIFGVKFKRFTLENVVYVHLLVIRLSDNFILVFTLETARYEVPCLDCIE